MLLIQALLGGGAACLVVGTALSLSRHPHWLVRGWDFPRVQIAALLLLCATGGWWTFEGVGRGILLTACGVAIAWHLYRIAPYTPVHPVEVRRSPRTSTGWSCRMVISNVQMRNRSFDRWLRTIERARPDIVVALETDEVWRRQLARLEARLPYVVDRIQDNYYGMTLLSRYELLNPQVRCLVDDDIPSITVDVRLPAGATFRLYVLHPRPPEPYRDTWSDERDSELMIVARELQRRPGPAVVAGDLNDVAWSHTTRLFQRVSRTLDPRVGRGLFNTFSADSRIKRWPLDHVFHTPHFELIALRRLGHVGSDHFPILAELDLRPVAGPARQEAPTSSRQDDREARDIVRAPVRGVS